MKIRLLALLFALVIVLKGTAQFSGAFAPANWTFSSTSAGGDGSVNTSGAPASIILNGSDNDQGGGYEDYRITIASTGSIGFSYSHSNNDIDAAYYTINGAQTTITSSGSGSLSAIAVTAGQVFSFRVVNGDNCCGRGVLTISNFVFTPATPSITTQPANKTACAAGNTTFTVVAANTTSYQWQENTGSGFVNVTNTGIYSGATTATLTLTGVTAGMNGYLYRVIATGSLNPPATSNSATLTVSPMTTSISSQTNIACNGGTTGAATVSVTGGTGTKTYSWAPSGGTAATASGLAAGNYTVTVTDATSCVKTQTVTLTQPTALVTTTVTVNVSCNGGSNGGGSVTASGGAGGYSYLWTPSGATTASITGKTAGGYTVTVTDANSCVSTKTVTITQPSAITATTSQTNLACNGASTGSATVTPTGGAPGYTYSWAPSGGTAASATGLSAGNYTVTVTDANSCSITKTYNLTQPTALTSTTSQTNIACNGGTTGAASVTPSGGATPYTYSWAPSGGTAASATGLSAGNYTVTITDANTCSITKAFNITQAPALATSISSQTNIACNGGTTGAATVAPTGGTPSYTYSWAPSGGTAASASGLGQGNYTVTVTDANSCVKTQTVSITQPTAITATTSTVSVSCNGGTNGSASVTPTGGSPGYTYSWAPSGGTAASATGLAAGNYTVTITDANTCVSTKTVSVVQPPVIAATTSQVNVSCNGGTNGSATVTPTGGTGAYTYSWAPSGGTSATASGLAQGNYTVTITDANSCVSTKTVSITQPTTLTATISAQTNIACNGASTGSATVTAGGGTPSFTYSWAPSGGTSATATGLGQGNYTVTVTDANSCVKTQTVSITQATALTTTVSAQTNVSCNGGTNGSATISASGGAPGYTYSWAPSGGTSATATGLGQGTYTVTITDANSCAKTQTVSITQPTAITNTVSQVNVACNGGTNGSASVTTSGGTPSYTYSWAPSGGTSATASGLAQGNYTVTITDANSCVKTQTVSITQPTVLAATTSQTNVACNGGTNGSASVTTSGGTPSYTYSWAPSGGTAATATGLAQGNYTVTITDANTCTITKSFTITQPNVITATTSQTNISCNGGTNGSAGVVATGGTGAFTYAWAPSGGTAAMATGLAQGNYTVTIKDANNCSITKSFTLTEPTAITATTSQTNVACNGGTTGSAAVTPTGGTPGYTYSWAPSGGTAASATGLAQGNYTVTITDANSCVKTQTVSITQPSAITSTVSQVNVSCNGGANGSATITPSGGTPGYTYAWTPSGGTAATATGLAQGNYTVTITDANSCVATKTVSITQPAVLATTISAQTNVSCNGGSNGSATVAPTGGTSPYTYAWAPSGGTAATATGLAQGNYTVTITDAKSCVTTQTVSITQPNAITATTSQTDVSCNGGTNGTATVTATGGTGAYTYAWVPSGGTAATATGLAQGNYTVTIKDANNCSITKTVAIIQPTAITATTAQTNVACNGGATGSATVTPTGGTPGYTYSWSPSGGTAASATGLAQGTYIVTIKDANNCLITKTVTITEPAAISATTTQVNVSCYGGADGTATVVATGGTPGYTYDWLPYGGNAATATGLTMKTYTVTITDANNCTTTKTVTITEPPVLAATISAQTNVSCNGGSNGSATIAPTGGTSPYTYAWAPSGGTAATASGLAQGNYTVTITDAKSCVTTQTVSITQPNAITATTSQTDVSCNGGTNGTATVTATGGTGAYTYAWAPSGGTAATATGLAQGNYTVTIKDANNCNITKTVAIIQPTAITATTAQTNVACNGGATGSATVTPTGGTPGYTYSWSPSGGTAATATGLAQGTYIVTIKDANNCLITKTVTITEPAAISATTTQVNVSCFGGANGSATVVTTGGTPGYTYAWAPSGGTAATASGLAQGNYTVTITDANSCIATKTVSITQPAVLATTVSAQTNVSCNGGSNGSATVTPTGGTTPYTYAWAPSGGTSATATGLAQGTYTVSITDAKSCVTTQTVSITEPNAITATTSQTNVSCKGGKDGSATVNVTGGTGAYTYAWAPLGGTAATATGLGMGTYTVTITDANNCSITQSFTITEPPALSATTSQTNVACNGSATGSASVIVSGGTGPYTYAWTPSGGTAATATGLVAGTYTVTITDAHNCILTEIFSITEPTALTATTAQINVSCKGGSDGSATATVSGGTGSYTYSWTPSGGTAATALGLVAGTYSVTITDANMCSLVKIVNIIEPNAITATVTQVNVSCNGGTNGSATIVASGGTGTLTYSWAPSGGTAATATGLVAGTYTVTITDANNCSITQNVTILEPPALTATVTHTNVLCNGGATGSATATVNGGTSPYTYAWAPQGGTAATATGLIVGSYTVTIIDANSCVTTQSVTITEPTALTATSTKTDILCHGDSAGTASVTPSGGTAPYTYSWAPYVSTDSVIKMVPAGTYTATITDANNCKQTVQVTITEPTLLAITSTQKNVGCNGAADGSAKVKVTGGFGAYKYSWAPSGGIADSASGLVAGTYTVTVTDGYSCEKTHIITITEPAVLSANRTKTDVLCNGDSTGVAIVTPIGGTSPYTYSWNPPYIDTDSTLTGLPAGTYICTITDAHNCTYQATVIIAQPSVLTASITNGNVSCNGGENGTATVTATGGSGKYTYSWAPAGGTSSTTSGLKAGTYTVTVTDSVGCITTQTVTITEPAKLVISGTVSTIACNGETATVSIIATGGTAPYTGTGTFTKPAGVYTFVVSDNNSCADSVKMDIKQPDAIKGSQTVSICAGDKLVVGDSTYTVSGTYVNVLKAVNACDSTVTSYLTVNSVDKTVTVAIGSITSNAINSTYQWLNCTTGNVIIPGATGQSYTVTASGDYAVIVTTGNCSDTSECTHVVAVGIDQYTISNALSVFPNPSNGTFTVRTTVAGTYTVINELGQTVRSFQLNSANNYSTTISDLENGAYFVIGINKNILMRQKIVVVQYR